MSLEYEGFDRYYVIYLKTFNNNDTNGFGSAALPGGIQRLRSRYTLPKAGTLQLIENNYQAQLATSSCSPDLCYKVRFGDSLNTTQVPRIVLGIYSYR